MKLNKSKNQLPEVNNLTLYQFLKTMQTMALTAMMLSNKKLYFKGCEKMIL